MTSAIELLAYDRQVAYIRSLCGAFHNLTVIDLHGFRHIVRRCDCWKRSGAWALYLKCSIRVRLDSHPRRPLP
jgi:hypothetical protein